MALIVQLPGSPWNTSKIYEAECPLSASPSSSGAEPNAPAIPRRRSDWTTLYSDLNPASPAKTLAKDAALFSRPSSLAMKRAWRFSIPVHAELSCLRRSLATPRPRGPASSPEGSPKICGASAPSSAGMREIMGLFIDKFSRAENEAVLGKRRPREGLGAKGRASVQLGGRDEIVRALDEKADPLLLSVDGLAFVELLKQLDAWPHQALEVFFWKRKLQERGIPMTSEEYVKGITVAGRIKDVDLALELFVEATGKRLKATSTYNALMGAYMYNGLAGKCQKLFQKTCRDECGVRLSPEEAEEEEESLECLAFRQPPPTGTFLRVPPWVQ
ncbi:hypothetical protein NL676_036580 [Syzygium grande]|nr:hypothetical protein NL676_036580 [Syzygium grande]